MVQKNWKIRVGHEMSLLEHLCMKEGVIREELTDHGSDRRIPYFHRSEDMLQIKVIS